MVSHEFALAPPPAVANVSQLGRAVFISALVHAMLLIWWRLPLPPIQVGGNPVLSVHLGNPYQPSPAIEEGPRAAGHTANASLLMTAKAVAPAADSVQQSLAEKRVAYAPPQVMTGTVSGGPQSLSPGNTNVLMVINEDGAVQDLIWQELPPLTRDKLDRLERHIREKKFLATGKTYTLREVIDVQRYLQR